MALMRGFTRLSKGGVVKVPANILREVRWNQNRLIEVKVQGPQLAQFLVLRGRRQAR